MFRFTLMRDLLTVGLLALLVSTAALSQSSDSALKGTVQRDRANRKSDGKLPTLTAAEHLSRGQVYYDNRQFPQAREHFQKIFDLYPTDPAMSTALFLTGRSYYWEREYATAIGYLDRVSREFALTKDGREGLSFKGACHVRLGLNAEAASIYEQYIQTYPTGERVESAHLNLIDALREAGKYDEANAWVDKARVRYPSQLTETNALQGRLRMYIYRELWPDAERTATLMLSQAKFAGSMTSMDEVKFLRAFAIEMSGKSGNGDARALYASIPDVNGSYYGGLASDKLKSATLVKRTAWMNAISAGDYPAAFRSEVLREAKKRKLDPRFILAIMKQESSFRPDVKSPSAARGLLQLTIDTALKYNEKAGFPVLQPDDLYVPRINIAIGCEYIAALRDEFGGLNEAIAASYNGGEDNAARWLNRSNPKEPGIFAAEIGFAETKNYVFKVMTNYRIYRELYDENLARK